MTDKIDKYTFRRLLCYADSLEKEMVGELILYTQDSVVGFHCPCGCGDYTFINVVLPDSPNPDGVWVIHVSGDGGVSLDGSVLRADEGCCESHFYIRESKVVWC